jgi:hypothetical protein
LVRFHLAFTPTGLALEGAPDQVLDAAAASPWRVPANAGRVLLQFQSANGFSAYQASFVVYGDVVDGLPARRLADGSVELLLPDGMATRRPPPPASAAECVRWRLRLAALDARRRALRAAAAHGADRRMLPVLRRLARSRAGYMRLLDAGCAGD